MQRPRNEQVAIRDARSPKQYEQKAEHDIDNDRPRPDGEVAERGREEKVDQRRKITGIGKQKQPAQHKRRRRNRTYRPHKIGVLGQQTLLQEVARYA